MWNKNERKGEIDQAKGKVKQAVGTVTGDDDLKAEGHVDETVGKVEAAIGRRSPGWRRDHTCRQRGETVTTTP